MVERMQKKLIKYITLLFLTAMTISMLLFPDRSAALALDGLNLWFLKMIPALLPFMVLSGLLIRLELSDIIASFIAPVLRPAFRLSDSCLYCVLVGFLCGFPMGAKVCAQSLTAGMTISMLLFPDRSAALALDGLNLWFLKMIPALLPFMILSGLLIRLELSDSIASFFAPVLRPAFRLSDSCLYCVLVGFLCGFPMGAKVCAQSLTAGKLTKKEASLLLAFTNNIDSCLYCVLVGFLCGFPMGAKVCAQSLTAGKLTKKEASLLLAFTNNIGPVYFSGYMLGLFPVFPMGAKVCAQSLTAGKLTKKEASLLLAFTNNIGPVYFSGYMLGLFPVQNPAAVWLGMYALPFVYGIVLRYTLYRSIPLESGKKLLCSSLKTPASAPLTPSRLLFSLHESILSGLSSIT